MRNKSKTLFFFFQPVQRYDFDFCLAPAKENEQKLDSNSTIERFATRSGTWGFKFLAPATNHASRAWPNTAPATKNAVRGSPNAARATKSRTRGSPDVALAISTKQPAVCSAGCCAIIRLNGQWSSFGAKKRDRFYAAKKLRTYGPIQYLDFFDTKTIWPGQIYQVAHPRAKCNRVDVITLA